MARRTMLTNISNIVEDGSAFRPTSSSKSNLEFVSSLRSNFKHHAIQDGIKTNGTTQSGVIQPQWTRYDDKTTTLEIPALDFTQSALEEEREQYDITLKLFFLPGTSATVREQQSREAVQLVLQELHMPSVDLLIVSFPGIYFDEEEESPARIETRGPVESEPEPIEDQITTWKALEKLQSEGLVKRLGVSEFGHDRLLSFLAKADTKPGVNQINLRDCCSVPRDLLRLAKSNAIDLLVHNDCSNILPRGTLRELLGPQGANILPASARVGDKRKLSSDETIHALVSLEGEVQPQWVVKYTAVVRNRGVVENKGYFAIAEVKE